jgi:leucyl-tRNA synthetase
MAVPAHDSRDYAFAKHFGLPIIQVIEGADITQESYDDKHGKMINSGILNGLDVQEAIQKIIDEIENRGLGRRKVNYRMRDAIFSRQRYWGEPFPIYYKDGIPYPLDESELPLELPDMDDFRPTKDGKPPLAKLDSWKTKEGYPLETSTMPGFAGSSAYYIRFMDPHNNEALVSKEAISYWKDVDFYLGGVEHATGHLIYSRFWNKFLKDIGVVIEEEPFKKLVNQGMIQGRSNFVYRIKGTNTFVSKNLKDKYDTIPIHVNVNIVNPQDDSLDIEKFMESEVLRMVDSKDKIKEVKFILEKEVVDQDGNKTYIEADISDPEAKYICGWEIEKMSKSKYNVVNPDEIIEKYGADTFRLYEMFLGPITQSKPWNTQGREGMHRFLKRFWSLYFDEDGKFAVVDEEPTEEELKILNKTIDKVERDIKNISFNTAISTMMVAVNSLSNLKTKKRKILEPLLILISPFAPHLSEELWRMLGHEGSIAYAEFPKVDKKYLVENTVKYVVTENGKKRFEIELGADMDKQAVEKAVLDHEKTQKLLEGKSLIKVIVVPKKLVNLVVKKQK